MPANKLHITVGVPCPHSAFARGNEAGRSVGGRSGMCGASTKLLDCVLHASFRSFFDPRFDTEEHVNLSLMAIIVHQLNGNQTIEYHQGIGRWPVSH